MLSERMLERYRREARGWGRNAHPEVDMARRILRLVREVERLRAERSPRWRRAKGGKP